MPPQPPTYYRAALRGDPRNSELLGRTFLAVLANGEVEEAVKLAERVLQVDKTDRDRPARPRRARDQAEAIPGRAQRA